LANYQFDSFLKPTEAQLKFSYSNTEAVVNVLEIKIGFS